MGVHPDAQTHVSRFDQNGSVHQSQRLFEIGQRERGSQCQSNAPELGTDLPGVQGVHLGDVEQQVAVGFDPDVQPDVAVAQGHRTKGSLAGTVPDDVVLLNGRAAGGRSIFRPSAAGAGPCRQRAAGKNRPAETDAGSHAEISLQACVNGSRRMSKHRRRLLQRWLDTAVKVPSECPAIVLPRGTRKRVPGRARWAGCSHSLASDHIYRDGPQGPIPFGAVRTPRHSCLGSRSGIRNGGQQPVGQPRTRQIFAFRIREDRKRIRGSPPSRVPDREHSTSTSCSALRSQRHRPAASPRAGSSCRGRACP